MIHEEKDNSINWTGHSLFAIGRHCHRVIILKTEFLSKPTNDALSACMGKRFLSL
jgi:hypothetical protein